MMAIDKYETEIAENLEQKGVPECDRISATYYGERVAKRLTRRVCECVSVYEEYAPVIFTIPHFGKNIYFERHETYLRHVCELSLYFSGFLLLLSNYSKQIRMDLF